MKKLKLSIRNLLGTALAASLALILMGCPTTPVAPPEKTPDTVVAPVQPTVPADNRPTIRVNAGAFEDIKDSKNVTWSADTGTDTGSTMDRPDLAITGTDIPVIYTTERYSMEQYSFEVANGKYLLKLHFSEDYDGIYSAEERVFTYVVLDGDGTTGKIIKEVKDFSPWKAAGAQYKAYVDSVPLTVTSGRITIKFTPQVENPQINAIEIIPQ